MGERDRASQLPFRKGHERAQASPPNSDLRTLNSDQGSWFHGFLLQHVLSGWGDVPLNDFDLGPRRDQGHHVWKTRT